MKNRNKDRCPQLIILVKVLLPRMSREGKDSVHDRRCLTWASSYWGGAMRQRKGCKEIYWVA